MGKKVGVPGIGAFLDVLFRKWLMEKGVDPKSVNFVEVAFPTMNDALKSASVDAVVTAEPFTSRIKAAGNGEVAAHYASDLARTDPIISYVATRAFADANPEAIKAFRASIDEAAKIVNADRDKASASISKFTKMPLEIVSKNRPNISKPELKGADFAWWVETMKQQNMLQRERRPLQDRAAVNCLALANAYRRLASEPPRWSKPTSFPAHLLRGRASASAETAARYGVGATPVREALSRLAARGLVDAIGQRGFRVKRRIARDLHDIF